MFGDFANWNTVFDSKFEFQTMFRIAEYLPTYRVGTALLPTIISLNIACKRNWSIPTFLENFSSAKLSAFFRKYWQLVSTQYILALVSYTYCESITCVWWRNHKGEQTDIKFTAHQPPQRRKSNNEQSRKQ